MHCEPGKSFKDEKCVVCDVGTYKEAAGNTNCSTVQLTPLHQGKVLSVRHSVV